MDACEVVRLFVNKVVVPAERRRRGNPGYGRDTAKLRPPSNPLPGAFAIPSKALHRPLYDHMGRKS